MKSGDLPEILERLRSALTGRYTIERELGRGGMATVYLAQDPKHGRRVAIKVLRPELAAALGPERFLREIQLTAHLQHPHILPLYDSGSVSLAAEPPSRPAAEFLFYVMPFIEAESLRDRLERERQLPVEDAVRITREVADALEYAHQHGLIHRDIKPENILLSAGHAIVADFGIARAVEQAGGTKLTETGLAVGTPDYMSPEQAAGDSELDGRTDQYSLACMLYELLAGHPPFLGKNPQEVRARHALDPVPPLRAARATVSDGIEAALTRALAKQPADRFTSVGAFAGALSPAEPGAAAHPPLRPAPESRQRWWPIAATLALLAVTALVWRLVHRPPQDLDPNLLAVAPFDVRGATLESWREGLVDYLSRSLDGAGTLRTVPPSRFLRNWSGRADRASAEALGRAMGAGLVVYGSVVLGGRDSVRLRAEVLNLSAGKTPADVEVRGDAAGIDHLADSLALAVLRSLGSDRAVAAVRNSPFGGVSLPALKEYLQGEQLYRHSLWDSALVHYSRATELDSGFALAYRRMFLVLGWTPSTRTRFETAAAYGLKAAALNQGLSPRDSLLLLADSLELALNDEDTTFFTMHRRLFAALDTAARRYPGDPEVWQGVGEARYHFGQPLLTPAEVLDAFDRAIALDSGFSPAYEHTVELAMEIGGPDFARRYTRPYPLLGSTDGSAPSLLLTAALLEAERSGKISVAPLVDTAQLTPLFRAGLETLGASSDSAELAVQVLRRLAAGGHRGDSEPWVTDSLMWPNYLATILLFRGHVRESYAVYAPRITRPDTMWYALFSDPFLDLSLLDTTRASAAAAWFSARPLSGLPWWFARGDTLGLRKFIGRAREASRKTHGFIDSLKADYKARAGGAYLSLLQRDTASALRAFTNLPDTVCLMYSGCFYQKLTQARLLAAVGDNRAAADLLDRWRWTAPPSPFFVIAALERAQLAERLGERELGITLFQRVVDTWRHADPELQPYVAEARAGLQRLTKEPRP